MMVPIQVIRWYRMQCYDGTDSCAIVVPFRRYCQLIQYRDAYKDGSIIGLEETAIMQMNSVLSVFIMDFMERFPPVKVLYNNLDIESQFMISMYNHAFREKSKKSSVI